jgi:hypothetical protein
MAAPPDKPALVYKQIEDTADYYEPSIYSILQMYATFEMQGEEKLEGFFPLTDVKPYTEVLKNGHIFAIGLLPPPNKVTQRPLDRSATLSNLGIIPVDAAGVDNSKGGPQDAGSGNDTRGGIWTLPGYQLKTSDVNVNSVAPGEGYPLLPPCHGAERGATNVTTKGEPTDKAIIYNYGPNGTGKMQIASGCVNTLSIPQAWAVFRTAYKGLYGKDPTATQLQFMIAHSKRETGLQWPNNNPGMLAGSGPDSWLYDYPVRANGSSLGSRSYRGFEDPVKGAEFYIRHIGPKALKAAEGGDVLGYLTTLAGDAYYGESIDQYYNNHWPNKIGNSNVRGMGWPTLLGEVARGMGPAAGLDDGSNLKKGVPKTCAFIEAAKGGENEGHGWYDERIKKNYPDLVKEKLTAGNTSAGRDQASDTFRRFRDPALYGTDCPFEDDGSVPDAAPDDNIKKPTPEPKKKKTAEELLTEQTAFTQGWTRNFQGNQNNEARSTAEAIERMKATPPLRMLVNPSSFKVSKEKVISDGTWTRTGNIIHHWGDNQDKIEGSGKVAAFFTSEIGMSTLGLNRSARNWSKGYQNFLSLYLLYRNNAAIYATDPGAKDRTFISLVGSIYIYYDGTLYIGSFDSFNITEDAGAPFTLEYSFSFTVRAWYLLDRPDPEATRTYGNATYGGLTELPTKGDPKVIAESIKTGEERKLRAAGIAPTLSPQEQKALGDQNDPLVNPPTDIPASAVDRGSTGITSKDFVSSKGTYIDAYKKTQRSK